MDFQSQSLELRQKLILQPWWLKSILLHTPKILLGRDMASANNLTSSSIFSQSKEKKIPSFFFTNIMNS